MRICTRSAPLVISLFSAWTQACSEDIVTRSQSDSSLQAELRASEAPPAPRSLPLSVSETRYEREEPVNSGPVHGVARSISTEESLHATAGDHYTVERLENAINQLNVRHLVARQVAPAGTTAATKQASTGNPAALAILPDNLRAPNTTGNATKLQTSPSVLPAANLAKPLLTSSSSVTLAPAPNNVNSTAVKTPVVIAPASKDSIYHPDEAHVRLIHLLLIVFGALLATSLVTFIALCVVRQHRKKKRLQEDPECLDTTMPESKVGRLGFDRSTRNSAQSDASSSIYSIEKDFPETTLEEDRYDQMSHYNSMPVTKGVDQERLQVPSPAVATDPLQKSPHALRFSVLAASQSQNDPGARSNVPSEYLYRRGSIGDANSTVVADDSISMVLGRIEYHRHARLLRGQE